MERTFKSGQIITVKPSHRADLGGDPDTGMVLYQAPTRKVKILWSNGRIGIHDIRSPYMERFSVSSGV